MDKRKDFIHIDDVFKGLRQGEEHEKPGAWLQMKDLLDKELPLGASAGNPAYRRYLLSILALLLVGGGAYYMHHQSDQNTVTPGPVNVVSYHSIPGENGKDQVHLPVTGRSGKGRSGDMRPGIPAKTHPSSPVAAKNNKAAGTTASAASVASAHVQQPENDPRRPLPAMPLPSGKSYSEKGVAKNGGLKPAPAISKSVQEESIAAVAAPAKATGSLTPATIQKSHIIEVIKPASSLTRAGLSENNSDNKLTPSEKEWKPMATWKGSAIVSNQKDDLYKEERDTFLAMNITRKLPAKPGPGYKDRIQLDTVQISRVENIRYIPLSRKEIMELKQAKLLPASYWAAVSKNNAAMATHAEHVDIVPLAAYKVSSKRVKTNTFGAIKNTATGLASVFDGTKKWYAALLLGGNTTIGDPGYGMQFGVAALYAFAERWTLSAELKYQNGYFSNFQLPDNTSTFEVNEQQSGNVWLYQGKEYKTSYNYTIKNKASLNIPVLLSYNLGRISIFGGPEFSYFLPLTWTKGTPYTEIINVSQTSATHTNPFVSKPLLLDETDFNSRFGMGYVLGLTYDFSRKVSLDARVSQMLWDNSGKYKVDALRNVYRLPTAELSIGFYFGRRDKVIYIMDRKK